MRHSLRAVSVAGSLWAGYGLAAPITHFANADDPALVSRGGQIYASNCGGCHGNHLQGQALWQLQDQFAHRRAPAQNATGHSWQHSDEDLFQITKEGRFPGTPRGLHSYMPAFKKNLSDRDILAVIAFIKFSWPVGMRISQSMLNPEFRGMPAHADKYPWTLPPNCKASIQNWSKTSK